MRVWGKGQIPRCDSMLLWSIVDAETRSQPFVLRKSSNNYTSRRRVVPGVLGLGATAIAGPTHKPGLS